MKPLIKKAFASVALFSSIATVAVAAPVSGTGAAFAVPDNDGLGARSAIVLADAGTINSMSVVVAMSHTWVGDLIMTLSNGTSTIRLLDRPGFPGSFFGDNSNLSANTPITFAATATQLAENMGAGCLNSDVIGLAPCSTDIFFLPEDGFGVFLGSAIAGTWTLNVSDNSFRDLGSVRSWTLNADVGNGNGTVPEPTTLALVALALAGIGAAGRRKA